MSAGLTKAERLAVDTAIGNRIYDLETLIARWDASPDTLTDAKREWRAQRDALLTARPKIAMMRRTQ